MFWFSWLNKEIKIIILNKIDYKLNIIFKNASATIVNTQNEVIDISWDKVRGSTEMHEKFTVCYVRYRCVFMLSDFREHFEKTFVEGYLTQTQWDWNPGTVRASLRLPHYVAAAIELHLNFRDSIRGQFSRLGLFPPIP